MRALLGSIAAFVSFMALTFSTAQAETFTFYPANNGFESPDVGSGYETGSVLDWVTTGGVGIAANNPGAGYNVGGATNGNHDGTMSTSGQAALLQTGSPSAPSSISQTISGFLNGMVSVSYMAENRTCCSGSNETVRVYLDGTLIDTETPANSNSTFQNYTTPFFQEGPGSHTLTFSGFTNGGDQTVFIDSVSLTEVVPEPSTWIGLSGLGIVGLILAAHRRRAGNAIRTNRQTQN